MAIRRKQIVAKKNSKGKYSIRNQQKEQAALKRKSETAFRLAYGLYTAPGSSGGAKAAKQLLVMKRKELPGVSLQTGHSTFREYRKLILDRGEALESLAVILLRATEESWLREKIIKLFVKLFIEDLGRCQARVPDDFPNSDFFRTEQGVEKYTEYLESCDGNAKDFWSQVAAGWVGLPEYLKLLDAESFLAADCSLLAGTVAENKPRLFTDLLDVVARTASRDWPKDSEMADKYQHEASYYSDVIEACHVVFSALDNDIFYNMRMHYSSAFWMWKSVMRISEEKDAMFKAQMARSVTVNPPEEEDPDFDENMDSALLYLSKYLNSVRCEYMTYGIDLFPLAQKDPLSEREIRTIVKKAFMSYDEKHYARTGSGCPFTRIADKEAVAEMVIRFWAMMLISRSADTLLDEKQTRKRSEEVREMSAAVELAEMLRQENEQLRCRLSESRPERECGSKEANAEIKRLRGMLHDAEAALTKERERIDEIERENKELRSMFELEMGSGDELPEDVTDEGISEEFFQDYIKKHKVLVWGLRPSTEQRYAELYPELSFMDSNRKLTRQQLENYDIFIMCTSNTNHGNYWAARDTAKAAGIKRAYLAKAMNDPKCLRWALGIALRSETPAA